MIHFPHHKSHATGRFCLVLVFGLLLVGPALAQSTNPDIQTLNFRIDQLQRDVQDLQRQLYQSGVPTGGGGTGVDTQQAARIEVRLQELDGLIRQLTGQMEELSYRVSQQEQRLANLEARMGQMENPSVQPATGAGVVTTGGTTPRDVTGVDAETLPGSGEVSQWNNPDAGGATTTTQPAAPVQSGSTQLVRLPDGPPEEQYNYAFGLLRQGDYGAAEVAFDQFIEINPQHDLAGNAKYWLGETYYVRGDYQNAAVTFAEGFQTYPDNSKAADNLLKLGLSLAALGRNADACATYQELLNRYPNAATALLQRARQEQQRMACT